MSQPEKPTAITHFDSAAVHYEKSTGGCTRELTRHFLGLPTVLGLYDAQSVVLDNACGTGIVAEEIINRCRSKKVDIPQIYAVDPAPNMVKIATEKMESLKLSTHFSARVMPGESLDFPDGTFSHNITNLGILFYADPGAGAREIYRTLKPGGVAVVTSWSVLGYLDEVIRPAQLATRLGETPFRLPIDSAWLLPEHLEKTMRSSGGFEQVEMSQHTVHYGASSLEDVASLLLGSFGVICKDWPESERKAFKDQVRSNVEKASVRYEMVDGYEGYGIPMEAIIALCTKSI